MSLPTRGALSRSVVLSAAVCLLAPVLVSGRSQTSPSPSGQRSIILDAGGQRGIVLFDHSLHESQVNPYPRYPFPSPAGLACLGCHHKTLAGGSGTEAIEFQRTSGITEYQLLKCSTCHKPEGDPGNPVSKVSWLEGSEEIGIELNAREASHRMCISCHQATPEEKFRTSSDRYKSGLPEDARPPGTVKFTRCSECHMRQPVNPMLAQIQDEIRPAPAAPPAGPRDGQSPMADARVVTPVDKPLGYAGGTGAGGKPRENGDAIQVADRWRIGFPEDPRLRQGAWYNPYRQNVLKGDYPVFGQHNFMVLTLESDTLVNGRRLPVGSNVPAQRPGSEEFFGRGEQLFARQNFLASIELFHGDTSFKPIDWRVRFSPNFNINYLNTRENVLVNIDPRRGDNRLDGYVGFQELFGEVRLGDTNKVFPFLRGGQTAPFFDTTFFRAGIQQFASDFRGFIFNDFNLGARLFGQAGNNRYNFNVAYFYQLEKDTNSELNTRVHLGEYRDQTLVIANLYRQDTFVKGYTVQFSFHHNNDRPSRRLDENDFPVRPALVGDARPHGIKAYYLGFAGDGHIGRMNLSHAFYQVLGHDTHNPIAGRRTDINARMAAAEVSLDRDWMRFKGSVFWASGDRDPLDDRAEGFDAIVDTPEFAGGRNSFWNSQGIPLAGTGILLVSPDSLLPSLRSNKLEGQANFVNPGIFIYNAGIETELIPKVRLILNGNYMQFHRVDTLETVFGQGSIRRPIGVDYGIGFLIRPFLNENIVFSAGYNSLIPGTGFKDIYSSNCFGSGPCGFDTRQLHSIYGRFRFVY